ncbi:MAG TPA: hypothetical protein VKA07_07415 [Candidatus Sulfotelmatobacter sp.]|nr:hypothetical protein [Candidatus Sulfotelmatobacter sp.]
MIERIRYRGWENCWKLSNSEVELIVLADVGPRVVWYGVRGRENQFHEVDQDAGKAGGGEFRLYGGHRLWAAPEVARTYFPDNVGVKVAQIGNALRFTAPVEDSPPGTRLQKEMEIEMDAAGSGARLTHRISNHDSRSTELAVWAPTMMRAGGRAILPLPARHPMDQDHVLPVGMFAVWSYTDFADPRWLLGTESVQLVQTENPTGRFREQMGGIFNSAGWGAHFRRGTLFVKRAAVIAGARYPDGGCNFELFTNPEFLEVETLGPLVELKPGETAEHVERWWLFEGVPDGTGEEWVRQEVAPRAENIGK